MWETKVKEATKNKDNLTFNAIVEFYKDGVLKYTFTFENMSEEGSLKKNIVDQLNQYKKIDELKPIDLIGPVDLTPVTPPEPPEKTPQQIAQEEYFTNVRRFVQVKESVRLGMIDESYEEYVTLSGKIKKDFKPEYIQFV